jgi:hypothetical protein
MPSERRRRSWGFKSNKYEGKNAKASKWKCRLLVFQDNDGKEYVSAGTRSGVTGPMFNLRQFDAEGPYMPIGFPKTKLVPSANSWMKDLESKGFSFNEVREL